jgi:hypothetical protein
MTLLRGMPSAVLCIEKAGDKGGAVDRLNAVDAEFLHLEDGIVHMHITGACVFDSPPPSIHDIEALVALKLHPIPRYRQRCRSRAQLIHTEPGLTSPRASRT